MKKIDRQRQNKILKILKDQSGMSFMFVLGVMLMLMAIGVSTLVAASSNFGLVQNQTTHNQTMILSDSIQKNIKYSLQTGAGDTDLENTMSAQIVKEIYRAYEADNLDTLKIPLEIELDNGFDLTEGNVKLDSIELAFPRQDIIIRPGAAATDIFPSEPKTAMVNATMTVTVIIDANEKKATSRAVYEYMGGRLNVDNPDNISFLNSEYGEWRLLKHEKMDS